ncbi:hypothetical protein KIN20_025571 [Parelaphostrongylus tenuis]|uniref:Uncharacterized protein n=1 Tax=Parelaphostrongylus tenuis TaxID=148309 RepID=A0AAD5QUH7_PARTN|nr:hypothetical protein KIN20_025571 [Parelaphostrongylus tenuis]
MTMIRYDDVSRVFSCHWVVYNKPSIYLRQQQQPLWQALNTSNSIATENQSPLLNLVQQPTFPNTGRYIWSSAYHFRSPVATSGVLADLPEYRSP